MAEGLDDDTAPSEEARLSEAMPDEQDAPEPEVNTPDQQPEHDLPRPPSGWQRWSGLMPVLSLVVAILSISATSFLGYLQLKTAQKTARLNSDSQAALIAEQDRGFLSGIHVKLMEAEIHLVNNNSQTLQHAGYWLLADGEVDDKFTMLEYYSTLAPLVACSDMSFPVAALKLPKTAKVKAAFLLFQVPSGTWWGISESNFLQQSDYHGNDPSRAASGLRANQLMADTTLEGYDDDKSQEIENGTGPVGPDSPYAQGFGVTATSTQASCQS